MGTEQQLVYNILNTIRDAEHNEDERLSERLMRSYLRTYRAECLRKYYKNGHIVDDEVFQLITLSFKRIGNTNEFCAEIPKVIRFQNNYGFYLQKNGSTIPILNSEEYNLNKRNPFDGKLVNAKTEGNKITLSGGELTDCIASGTEAEGLIGSILDEVESQTNNGDKEIIIPFDFYGVLHNPEDAPGYDWEVDIYPFPSEKGDELKSQILRKEFGIMIQAKRDEVQNSRSDSVRYHENQNIEGGGGK